MLLRKGVSEVTGVTLTIEHLDGKYPETYTFECHSPEKLAEIVQGTYAVMPHNARLTRIDVG